MREIEPVSRRPKDGMTFNFSCCVNVFLSPLNLMGFKVSERSTKSAHGERENSSCDDKRVHHYFWDRSFPPRGNGKDLLLFTRVGAVWKEEGLTSGFSPTLLQFPRKSLLVAVDETDSS